MMRLVTFLAATAFLVLLAAVIFFVVGTVNMPFIWLHLAIYVGFDAACALVMSEGWRESGCSQAAAADPNPCTALA